ncbi:sugar phosphate isomerase/epimerase family protein [Paenarthrobacter sp. NPDC089714]|uniref:sugar phosphate isomerase/epimerase family protein n=1 Tax=Paenarthrobacter sp. NPDC089714 TaxID=3364377 RepID=UPI00380FE75B
MTPAISLQLYTVNAALQTNLDAGIARLAEIGFTTVEAFAFVDRAPALKAALDAHGITARTGHAFLVQDEIDSPDGIKGKVPSHEDTFRAAKELGLEVVIDPFVPAELWQTRADVEGVAARLNAAARTAATYGLSVGYHNHDHEFRAQIEGRSAYELFIDLLEPEVKLELDLYWANAAGVDVHELLPRLGNRLIAVHIKDGPWREGISTAELPKDQLPAGQGDVPLAAGIATATALEYAVIEFDHYEGDIFDGVTQSFTWLQNTLANEDRKVSA